MTLYKQFLSLAKFLEFVDYFFFDLSKNYEQYRIIPDNHYTHIILNLWDFTFTISIVLVGLSLYINFFLFLYIFNSKKIKNIKITKNFLFKIIFIILFGFPFFLLIKIKDIIFYLQKNSCNNSLHHGFFNYILVELTCYLDELKRLLYTMKIVYRKNKEINFYILNKLI